MQKQEPRIFAGDLSDEELLEWMQAKVNSAHQLKEALSCKAYHLKALEDVNERLETLTSFAALELIDKALDPTLLQEFQGKRG
jgi:hypothetical protein